MRRLCRFLFWLLAIPVMALLVVFALSNRQGTLLALWPFADGMELPTYLVVLVPALAGLVLGLLTGAARRLAAQARAASLTRRVTSLERDLEGLRAASASSSASMADASAQD